MVVDTSVLIAIADNEPERDIFLRLLASDEGVLGTPTLVETGLVLSWLFPYPDDGFLTRLVDRLQLTAVDFSAAMAAEARRAHRTFGRGRHPARLNFGDCMSYAVAKVLDLPLLYKGDDFALTDLRPAHAP